MPTNRTYTIGKCGRKIFFDPDRVGLSLREWWCSKCRKLIKLTPLEKRLVMVAYKFGRQRQKEEMQQDIKKLLGIFPH